MILNNRFQPASDMHHNDNDNALSWQGKIILFKNIPGISPYRVLNDRMILICDVSPSINSVFGYDISKRMPFDLTSHFSNHGDDPAEKSGFVPAVDNPDILTIECLIYLMEAGQDLGAQETWNFGKFMAYRPEGIEETLDFAAGVAGRSDVIVVHNAMMIDRHEIVNLISENRAFVAEADPKVIFHPNEETRARLLFPALFPAAASAPETGSPEIRM